MTRRHHRPRDAAFTLIEVLIGVSLMSLILVSAYACLSAGFSSRKVIEPRIEITQNARVAMALLTADLRNACPLATNTDFLGVHRTLGEVNADNLDFATHNYTPRKPCEGDFCEVSYFVDRSRETGQFCLWRRRNPTIAPDPMSGGNREEIATGLLGVRLEYFDGTDWYDDWGETRTAAKAQSSQRLQPNLAGLPEAVRITLLFDSNPNQKSKNQAGAKTGQAEPPMVFQTIVRLELADTPAGTAAGNAADSSQPGANANPAGAGGNGVVQ